MKRQKGFTLIELLVVISIIGLLAAAGLATYTQSQKRARNAKRQADIISIADALELSYELNPGPCTAKSQYTYSDVCAAMFAGGIPLDPSTGVGYTGVPLYTGLPVTGATTFSVCATLEPSGTYCRANRQ